MALLCEEPSGIVGIAKVDWELVNTLGLDLVDQQLLQCTCDASTSCHIAIRPSGSTFCQPDASFAQLLSAASHPECKADAATSMLRPKWLEICFRMLRYTTQK